MNKSALDFRPRLLLSPDLSPREHLDASLTLKTGSKCSILFIEASELSCELKNVLKIYEKLVRFKVVISNANSLSTNSAVENSLLFPQDDTMLMQYQGEKVVQMVFGRSFSSITYVYMHTHDFSAYVV